MQVISFILASAPYQHIHKSFNGASPAETRMNIDLIHSIWRYRTLSKYSIKHKEEFNVSEDVKSNNVF